MVYFSLYDFIWWCKACRWVLSTLVQGTLDLQYRHGSLFSLWNSHINRKLWQYSTEIYFICLKAVVDSETGFACCIGPEVFLAENWRTASSAKIDNKAEWRNMPNCWGNSVQRLIFPKWFTLERKAFPCPQMNLVCSLSALTRKLWGRENNVCTLSRAHTRACAHTYTWPHSHQCRFFVHCGIRSCT